MLRHKWKTAVRVFNERGVFGVAEVFFGKLAKDKKRNLEGPTANGWSEYVSWLTFANAGMLEPGNVNCMDYAIQNLPSEAPIVEIGSFCGLSTNLLTYLKEKYARKSPLITCDKWEFEGAKSGGMLGDSKSVSQDEYKNFAKETFMRNVRFFSRHDLPFTIESTSDEFFEMWSKDKRHNDVFEREIQLGGPISFCYIDGNHSYDFVKRDFENCDRYLQRGGFLLFDDSSDGSFEGVHTLVQEILERKSYDLLAKAPNYFFRKN